MASCRCKKSTLLAVIALSLQNSIIQQTVNSHRFRPHPGERRPVVGADVVVGDGDQEAGRGADRTGTLGQVWAPLLLQVQFVDCETALIFQQVF